MNQQPVVVLIHGLFGFRKLLWLEYFNGVRSLYESMGLRVLTPGLPWAGTIEQRAQALALQLKHEQGPLHLLAHSMGGLDGRYWITHMDGDHKVASLTTLSTPHRGSSVSEHINSGLSPLRLFPGARSLTRPALKSFNANTPDSPTVCYRSYSAYRPIAEQVWSLRRFGKIIQQLEGNNDNLVSVHSAQWGDHINTLPCDHFELIFRDFWLNPFRKRNKFDPMPIYRDIGEWILQHQNSSKEKLVAP